MRAHVYVVVVHLVYYLFLGALTSPDVSNIGTLEPKQLFFASSGRIGVIIDIDPELSLHMTELQRNMEQTIASSGGGLSHTAYVDALFGYIRTTDWFLDSEPRGTEEGAVMPKHRQLVFSMGIS